MKNMLKIFIQDDDVLIADEWEPFGAHNMNKFLRNAMKSIHRKKQMEGTQKIRNNELRKRNICNRILFAVKRESDIHHSLVRKKGMTSK